MVTLDTIPKNGSSVQRNNMVGNFRSSLPTSCGELTMSKQSKPSESMTAAAVTLSFPARVLEKMMLVDDLADLSVRAARIFLMIYSNTSGEPFTIRSMAAAADVPKPSVTRAFDRLEFNGLLKREPDPSNDRRSVIGVPTAKGIKIFLALAKS